MSIRLDKLRQALREQELDAILVTRPENQRYLSGFTGGEGALLITQERALLLIDFRYFEQVEEEAPDFELLKVEQKASLALKGSLKELEIKMLGFESTHLPYSVYQEWRRATRGIRWRPTKEIVETIRMIKDQEEVAQIRKAVALRASPLASSWARDPMAPNRTLFPRTAKSRKESPLCWTWGPKLTATTPI